MTRVRKRQRPWPWALVALVMCACACTVERRNLVSDPGPDAGSDEPDAEPLPPPVTRDAAAADGGMRCGKHSCACDNGLDDDADGLVDGLDPECTAGFDDDEVSFATGLPNKQGGCRDCFWDDNAGSGDDACRYPAECLSGSVPNNNGNCSSCEVGAQCITSCLGRTPNGCDCFGCCEVTRPSGERVFTELAETCQLTALDDLERCPRCVQNTACLNPCARCELCLGKTAASLPADCKYDAGGLDYSCEDGRACRISSDCSTGEYCLLGCCLVDVL